MRPYRFKKHSGQVLCVAYSPCGKFVATGGKDCRIFIWKVSADGNKHNFNFGAHGGPVKSVVYSSDGNFLVTAGDDKIVKLWKIISSGSKAKFIRSFVGHTNWVLKADISPDSRMIASICDKFLRIWDAASGRELFQFKNTPEGNRTLKFHPEGNYVAIGGLSGKLQIFDLRSNKLTQVYDTREPITQVSFHPSGQFIACSFEFIEELSNSPLKV